MVVARAVLQGSGSNRSKSRLLPALQTRQEQQLLLQLQQNLPAAATAAEPPLLAPPAALTAAAAADRKPLQKTSESLAAAAAADSPRLLRRRQQNMEGQREERTLPQQQQQQADTPQNSALAASAHNPNSFHWEEKQLTAWCLSTLKETLAATKLSLLDGTAEMSFFNVTVRGEASSSMSRGKKMLFFDLSAEADWTVTARDKTGRFLADSRGHLRFGEFSPENAQDIRIYLQGDGRLPAQQRLDDAAKKEAPQQIQAILTKFYEQLKQQ
ncbi:hypothetical protein Esti_004389 [Eimeria stiedai]